MSEPLSSNPPAAEWLELLLSYLWEHRGTDLHLTAGSPPLVRVDGELHPVPDQPMLKPADTEAIADVLLDETDRATFASGATSTSPSGSTTWPASGAAPTASGGRSPSPCG